MSTSSLALIIAATIVGGFVVSTAFASLLLGGWMQFFGKGKLTFLRSQKGSHGFAFHYHWNQAREAARFNLVKIKLFNSKGKPSFLELVRSFPNASEPLPPKTWTWDLA